MSRALPDMANRGGTRGRAGAAARKMAMARPPRTSTTAPIPAALRTRGACSLEDPAPRFSPATTKSPFSISS